MNTVMASDCELTILMPCLNEQETLKTCVDKATAYLRQAGISGEVLVADNGSTDGSQAIATACGARVVNVPVRGYGAALTSGIQEARGRYIIMGDADDSYDFTRLDGFLAALRQGSDLVMGNRFQGGIEAGAMPPLHRYLGNPVLSFIGRLFFKIPVGDFHCGLRGFRTEAVRSLDLCTTGMEFASEMIVKSALAGLRISEVPTVLKPDGRSRAPHLRTWRDGWRHLKFLLIYSPRWLFMIPGAVLGLIGALSAIVLFFGPLQLRNVVFDLNTFIASCLLVISGSQLLSFGLLSRIFASVAGLLPNTPRVTRMIRHTTTDRLVWAGGLLFLAGFLLIVYAIDAWAAVSFGELPSARIPRTLVAGSTLVVIGLQAFSSAFFIGILSVPTRTAKP